MSAMPIGGARHLTLSDAALWSIFGALVVLAVAGSALLIALT